jgi:hypothetical protein
MSWNIDRRFATTGNDRKTLQVVTETANWMRLTEAIAMVLRAAAEGDAQ